MKWNNFAITTQQLGTALMRSAGAANTYQVSLEKSIGYTAAIGEVTRESGSIIGNSLKSIYSRITSIPKAIEAMSDIGISIKDSAGDMRSVEGILDDLAGKWDTLSNEQQQNLGLQIAGRFQLSRFLIMMKQYDTALKATDAATNSAGSGYRENAEYLKSYEAQINIVKNAWTEAIISMRDTGLGSAMVIGLSAGLELLKVFTAVIDKLGVLPTVIALGSVAMLLLSANAKNLGMSLGRSSIAFLKMGVDAVRGTSVANAGITATASTINVMSTSALRASVTMNKMSASTIATSNAMRILTAANAGAIASTNALTASAVVSSSAMKGLRTILMLSIPIAGFMAIGAVLTVITSKITEYTKKQKMLNEELEDFKQKNFDAVSTNKKQVDGLISSYNDLSVARKDGDWNSEKEQEYLEVQEKLGELFPSLIDYIDAKGKKHFKTSEEILKEVKATEELFKAEQLLKLANSKDDYKEKIKNIEEYTKKAENLGNVLNSVAARTRNGATSEDIKKEDMQAVSDQQVYEKLASSAASSFGSAFINHLKIEMSSFGTELSPALQESFDAAAMSINFGKLNETEAVELRTQLALIGKELEDAFSSGSEKNFKEVSDSFGLILIAAGATKDEVEKLVPTFNTLTEEQTKLAEALAESGKISDGATDALSGQEEQATDTKDAIEQLTGVSQEQIESTTNLISQYDLLTSRLSLLARGTEEYDAVNDELLSTSQMLTDMYPVLTAESLQLIDTYERLTQGSYAQAVGSTELGDTIARLIQLHPELEGAEISRISMMQAVIKNIAAEKEANDVLRKAMTALSEGKLTAEEVMTLAQLENTNARIKNINSEISALDKMMQVYNSLSGASKAGAEAISAEFGKDSKEAEGAWKSYMRYSQLAESQQTLISNEQAVLADATAERGKYVNTLKDSENVMGKSKDTTDKASKAQDKYNEKLKESIFLANTYKEALEKLNLEQSRLNEIKSKYPKHSKEYQDALQKELAVLYEKKELNLAEAAHIRSQISSGNVAKTGIVTKGSGGTYTGKYASEINAAASKHGIDAQLIAAVIQAESGFNPNAKSSSGARGLMQLMPATAKGLGVKDSYNAEQNIMGGAKYLAEQLKTFGGDIKLALAAYNAGPGNVKKHGGIPPFKETQNYVKKITDALSVTAVSTAKAAGQSVADYYAGNGFKATSAFGTRTAPKSGASTDHQGQDFSAPAGTSIKSLRDGKVIASYYHTTGGNIVSIQQDDGTVAKYMHMQSASNATVGQSVKAGEQIGKVGTTGNSTGNHLHLEIEQEGKAVDPLPYLKEQGQSISDASQAVAEHLQDLDALNSDLNAKSQQNFAYNEEIRELQREVISTGASGFEKSRAIVDQQLENSENRLGRLSSTSVEYRKELDNQTAALNRKQAYNKQEYDYYQSLINSKRLDGVVSDELKDKLHALGLEGSALAQGLQQIAAGKIDSIMGGYAESIDDLDYAIDRSKVIQSLYEEGTAEYANEVKNQIDLLQTSQKEILNRRNELKELIRTEDLSIEKVKEYKEELEDLSIAYWNVSAQTKSLKDATNAFVADSLSKMKDEYINGLKKESEEIVKSIEGVIKATEEQYDSLIEKQQDRLDAMDEEIEKEDRLKALREVDDDIAKTKGDNRFSYITAEGEEILTYNKERVSELEKQRTDMLKQYERDDLKKSIQDEIARLEKARKDKVDILNREIEDTKTRYDQLIATEEIKWNGLIESAKNGTLEFDTLMNEFYGASLINLQSYVAESQAQIQAIKDAYASLASLEVSLPSVSGGGGSSGGSSSGNVASASNPLGMSEKDFDKYVANKDKRESGKDVGGSAKKENQALRDKYGIDLDDYGFNDLKKYHDGGIVGKSPSRLAELTNKLFNVKPGEQVVKSLIGELQIPPQNFSNLFTNLNAMLSTIQLPSPPKLPNLNMSNQQQPAGDTINLNGVVIKADNPNQFFKDLDLHIRMNKS